MKSIAGFLLIVLICLSSCTNEPSTDGLVVKGTIKGLKVGNILLQQVQDSALVTLDSVALDGSNDFELLASLDEPQILYLHLDVKDGSIYDDRIAFFAEDTVMTINSSLESFEEDAIIEGSKNQDILTVFTNNTDRLDKDYTALMKRSMELSQESNPSIAEIEKLNTDYEKYLRKRILYAISYASLHKDMEVAPYILLKEGFDANPVLLDSVYQMMPKKIQTSLYGKDLSELLNELKNNL